MEFILGVQFGIFVVIAFLMINNDQVKKKFEDKYKEVTFGKRGAVLMPPDEETQARLQIIEENNKKGKLTKHSDII